MSKKRSASGAAAPPQHDLLPGFAKGRFAEVAPIMDDPRLGSHPVFPQAVNDSIMSATCDIGRTVARQLPEFNKLKPGDWAGVYGLVNYCIEQGFALALYRYAEELRHVPEVAGWQATRKTAGDKGRATQAKAKAERQARIREMFAKGIDVQEIATEEKCSVPTVYRALAAPQSKAPNRRRSPRR